MRFSIWFVLALFAMPMASAFGQGAPEPPPGPDGSPRTVKGDWRIFEEQGAQGAGIADDVASIAFLCFPGNGYALLYRASRPFPDAIRAAKTVHILFGELHDPESGKGGSVIEGRVDPPIDDRSLLISGAGVDQMLALAEAAALDLRMAVLDGESIVQADNFATKGSTATIGQLKQSCGS